jgi:hypothetical protein
VAKKVQPWQFERMNTSEYRPNDFSTSQDGPERLRRLRNAARIGTRVIRHRHDSSGGHETARRCGV